MLIYVQPVCPGGHAEMLLWAAVIRRAALDIALYKGTKRRNFKKIWDDAYRWIFSEDTGYENSFVNVCFWLNQRPNELRKNILELRKEDVRKYDMIERYGRVHSS